VLRSVVRVVQEDLQGRGEGAVIRKSIKQALSPDHILQEIVRAIGFEQQLKAVAERDHSVSGVYRLGGPIGAEEDLRDFDI
jgi:hypothetical protein